MYLQICFTGTSSPKLQSVSLYWQTCVQISGNFDTSAPTHSKWSWRLQGQIYPISSTSTPKTFILLRFIPQTVFFLFTGHFLTNVHYDPKHYKVKGTHMCSTSNSESQISTVMPYDQPLSVTGHFETVQGLTPKWCWTYCVLSCWPSWNTFEILEHFNFPICRNVKFKPFKNNLKLKFQYSKSIYCRLSQGTPIKCSVGKERWFQKGYGF